MPTVPNLLTLSLEELATLSFYELATLLPLNNGNSYLAELTLDELATLSVDELATLLIDSSSVPQLSLLPENVLVIYREGNDDSYEFARYYGDIYDLTEDQLLAVPCSGNEFLDSFAEFENEIENTVLANLSFSDPAIKCIVVSYGVPGGFYDSDNDRFVSTTSRLSNIYHPYEFNADNLLFNRKQYQVYNNDDAFQSLVVARFDAPDLVTAKAHVDKCKSVSRTGFANGKFFFDNVNIITDEKEAYYNDLGDFESFVLPVLNMPVTNTIADTVNDIPLFRLKNDSFVWAWESDRAGYSYFQETKTARIFCYNADMDGAGTVRDAEDRRWPMLAMSSGYAACAGTVDSVEYDELLRPGPFFEALLRGASLGEAYLYALPKVNSSLTLFGDPLIRVRFPTGDTIDDFVSEIEGFSAMAASLASSIAYNIKQRNSLQHINQIIGASNDLTTKVDLFVKSANAASSVAGSTISVYRDAANELINFPISDINDFLSENNIKLSRLVKLATGNGKVLSANIATVGSWYVETSIVKDQYEYNSYHFVLEVSSNPDYSNVIYLYDSSEDSGWFYEKMQDEFTAVPTTGVTSSYAGRKIRYVATETLIPGTIYYTRIKQKNELNESTEWVTKTNIIYT